MDVNFLNNKFLNFISIFLFFFFYFFLIFENFLKIKKSGLAILFSGSVWFLFFFFIKNDSEKDILSYHINHFLLEYSELFFFIFIAMIFINSIKSSGFFDFIKFKVLSKEMSYKKIYWMVGLFSFFMSPLADNLTTSLLMSSIILSIDSNNKKFVNLNFINIVIASNSGGVFCPFGDITTLMIWQSGVLKFHFFFYAFFSSFVSFLIPSLIISFYIPSGKPCFNISSKYKINSHFYYLIFIFFLTLFLTVLSQVFFKISSVIGMMFGFGFLFIFELFCKKKKISFDLATQINNIEWDTLFFFYGAMLFVSAFSCLGVLKDLSAFIYDDCFKDVFFLQKHTIANFFVGIISAFIDNIPITFAILNMNINMNYGEWLILTLTIGTGGSLFSFGSAAGIALMCKSKHYTFISHFKWTWCIFLGYIFGVFTQILFNKFFLFF